MEERKARVDPSCPVCDADLPLAGDERPGEQTTCTYCGAPYRFVARADDDEALALEEDY